MGSNFCCSLIVLLFLGFHRYHPFKNTTKDSNGDTQKLQDIKDSIFLHEKDKIYTIKFS